MNIPKIEYDMQGRKIVTLKGLETGEIIGNRYFTTRLPHHYFIKYQGFGISKNIVALIADNGIDYITIEYKGEENTLYQTSIFNLLANSTEYIDDSHGYPDTQYIIPKNKLDTINTGANNNV